MKLFLLLTIILPVVLWAQPVEPVISNDYLRMVQGKTNNLPPDSIPIRSDSVFKLRGQYPGDLVKKVLIKNGAIIIKPLIPKQLFTGGYITNTLELGRVTRQPALQHQYVQGRGVGGSLQWRGPETGELFSFGPAIHTLEFDGIPYPYDINGRLTAHGGGNGNTAQPYDNTIFRTGVLLSQEVLLRARLYRQGKRDWLFKLTGGRKAEQTFIQYNRNSNTNGGFEVSGPVKKWTASLRYHYTQTGFSNGNRNGFLNRVYQDALLTPAGFSNKQGYVLGNGQRSYADSANNPYFLLRDNENGFNEYRNNASLTLEQRISNFRLKFTQGFEALRQRHSEVWKKGSAFFKDGIGTRRLQNNRSWFSKAQVNYDFRNGWAGLQRTSLNFNYILNNVLSNVQYSFPASAYRYRRAAHDISMGISGNTSNGNDMEAGFDLANKFYFSNTTARNGWLLPSAFVYLRFNNLDPNNYLSLKLLASHNSQMTEPGITRSRAGAGLLQHTPANAGSYFPVQEVMHYNNLRPVLLREWKLAAELWHRYNLGFSAEIQWKHTADDLFPVFENNQLLLKNLASHRHTGLELQAWWYYGPKKKNIRFNTNISFTTWKNIITRTAAGYEGRAVAGFSNIYNVLLTGRPLGTIAGNGYRRNADGALVIDAGGFPLASGQPVVLGNPIPDFIMKWSQGMRFKKLSLNADLEWTKGGDRWNGTRAVLDYYGRSAQSATSRNIRNYIFAGVLENGQPNTKPVDFYNPALPLEQQYRVREGFSGVAENYIEKAGSLRIRNIQASWPLAINKKINSIVFAAYVSNIIIASSYKGVDPAQLLNDDGAITGLDFFNLPSTKNIGISISIQF